jgi:4-amino-4-deoxy-L-arabinose transferase-like glycosyltransferase
MTRLRRALEPVVALVACLAGALVLRLPTLDMPLDRDASVYAVIGRSLGGALPYRDLIDHKQPVVYPVYALLEALAPRSDVAIRLASAVAAGLAAWLLFVGLRPFVGRTRAAVAAALALGLGASRFVQGFELNTEHLLVLTGTLLVVAALRLSGVRGWWPPFAVGLLCGLAILTKAIGVLFVPAALAPFLLRRPAIGVLVPFAVGTAVPLLAVAALWAAHGALGDLTTWNWTYNRQYTAALPFSDRISALKTYPADLLLIAVAAVAGVLALRSRGWRDPLALTLSLWLAGAVIGALLGGYGYAHYYAPIVPPAAALLAVPTIRARALAAALAVVAVAPFAIDYARGIGRSARTLSVRYYGPQARLWATYEPVGALLRPRSRPGDRLFVAGNEAGFYWQGDMRPATRLLYDSPLNLRPELTSEVTRDLCARPPRFVVLPLGTLPPYAACLGGAGYRPIGTLGPSVRVMQRG